MTQPEEGEPLRRGVDLRLAPVAVGTWVGAVIGLHIRLPTDPSFGLRLTVGVVAALGTLLVVLAVVGGIRVWEGRVSSLTSRSSFRSACRGAVGVALVGLVAALAVGATARENWERGALTLAGGTAGETQIVARIVADPSVSSARWGGPAWKVKIRVPGGVDLLADVNAEDLGGVPLVRGTVVRFRGRVEIADPARPPFWGFLRVDEIEEVRSADTWQRVVSKLKNQLSGLTGRIGSAGALIGGMAIGDDRGMSKDTAEAMLTTSLTHLTAVSGSHVAISLSVINALLPGRRVLRAFATWVFLVFVVAVVGPEPAVVRAVSMGALAAWGLTMKRGGQPLALLFVVTATTVLVDPWSAMSLGFALSTVATAGILTLGRAGTRWTRELIADSAIPEVVQPVARAVAEAVVIAVVAQAVTLPILALVNPWLPTWGVVANLLVAPIVTPLTLLGLAAAATCLWWPAAAEVCVALAAPLARYMEATALRIAGWPLAQFPWPQGWPGLLLALTLTALTTAASTIVARTSRNSRK